MGATALTAAPRKTRPAAALNNDSLIGGEGVDSLSGNDGRIVRRAASAMIPGRRRRQRSAGRRRWDRYGLLSPPDRGL